MGRTNIAEYELSLSEALADELKGTGVKVTALCPGPTSTGLGKSPGMEAARLFNRGVMDAETVAPAGYEGLMKGRKVVVPGFRNKAQRQRPGWLRGDL